MMDNLLLYKILKNRTGAEISASGNPAIMSDTLKNNPMNEMKVFGWSKQERTTGAQLLDIKNVSSSRGEIASTQHDGYVITAQGVYAEGDNNSAYRNVSIKLDTAKVAGKIITASVESAENDAGETLSLICDINYLKPDGAISWNLFGMNKPITVSIPADAKLVRCRIHIIEENEKTIGYGTYTTTIKGLMASIGDKVIPWEPYTGGQPSPSPDYPQEIVSAGSDGKIGVEVRGKNLVDVYGYSANGIPSPKAERILFNTYGTTLSTTEKTDKLIVHQEIIDGATANSYTSGYFCIGINRKLETGKDYIITFNINVIQNPFSVSTIFVLFNGIEANRAEVIGDKVTVKVSCKEDGERQYVEVRNCGMSLEISNFMITEKDENTIYEPYYEPQTISISTPTGLPAIPVDTDGNYTDANGQQWIADYVDLKLGKLYKKVTRLNLKDVDAINIAHGFHSNGNGYLSFSVKNVSKEHRPISNRYKGSMWTRESGYTYVPNSNTIVFVDDRFTDKQTAIKLVQDTYVIYALTSQIETDLTPEEIQAYKNLVTYAGTTIVENDAECYMEVSAGGGDSLRAKKLALLLGD